MTPFTPGRESAEANSNRLQDAFLKVGNDNIPKQQLDQLVLIALGQQGLALGLQMLGNQLGFQARPAPNGRPRG